MIIERRHVGKRLSELVINRASGTAYLAGQVAADPKADITGQTSVNVNRVLADMERQGLIKRKGRDIEFIDWAEMRRVASFQPTYLE